MQNIIPTHKVSFYGVKCYTNDNTGEMWGCNWFWSALIMPAVWLHWILQMINPGYSPEGFPLKVIEEYRRGEQ